jgi:hypothetical protein
MFRPTLFTIGSSSLAICALTAPVASSQVNEALFFTSNYTGNETTLSGSFGTPLGSLNRADIAVVTPDPMAAYSAEPFLTKMNTNVELGDRDGDGVIYQVLLTYGIDALHFCQPGDARNLNLFMSIQNDLAATSSLPEIRDGAIFSLRGGGTIQVYLSEAHINAAFGLAGAPFDVDAFAIDPYGNIALSFDDDTWLYGGSVLAEDGALLVIPAVALTLGPCQVTTVIPNSGFILHSEAALDGFVASAGVAGNAGTPITTISDLDGLDVDPDGGSLNIQIPPSVLNPNPGLEYDNPFEGQWLQVSHWRFNGLALTGASVLTTSGGGAIESMNGVLLGSPVVTTGTQVGLAASGSVRALDGLASVAKPNPARFVLDGDTTMAPGLPFELYWQGAKPGSAIFLGFKIHAPGALTGAAPPSGILMNPGHCLFMTGLTLNPTPIPAGLAGGSGIAPLIPGIVPPGLEITIQAFGPLGSVAAVSSPMTVHY